MLALLIEDAYEVWAEIPDADLNAAVVEALRMSRGFVPRAGQVADAFRESRKQSLVLGGGRREGDAAIALQRAEDARWALLSEEQKQAEQDGHRAFFREQRAKLNGGVA